MNIIKIENIGKKYSLGVKEHHFSLRDSIVDFFKRKKKNNAEFWALKDVNFEVKKGEVLGIIGKNGAGKSTLLKILSRITPPTEGKIEMHGCVASLLEVGTGFNPELTGRENIFLNGTIIGMSQKEIIEKFDKIVEFSEIGKFLDTPVKRYSSGMYVRLAFSIAAHLEPEILIVDEVLSVGDIGFKKKCFEFFKKLKEKGTAIIIVSHDIATVRELCDRAMLLHEGKLVKIGKAEDIGNVYIYDNMSDEEKRIFDEEKERIEKAEKNLKYMKGRELEEERKKIELEKVKLEERKIKLAEITKVIFFDKDGKEKNVFQTGDGMSIRVYFKQNKKVPILNFGLGIYSQEDFYFGGFNSIRDRIDTKKAMSDGYYQINLKNIPFNENSFYLKLNVAGDNLNNYYDFVDKSKETFRVFSTNENPGNVSFNYNWE